MKRVIPYILIFVFVISNAAEMMVDFYKSTHSSIVFDDADDSEKKETEKEDNCKDKIFSNSFCALTTLKPTQKFYIEHLFFLPKPLALQDIIPPELV